MPDADTLAGATGAVTTDTRRIFFALWPDQAVRDQLLQWQQYLAPMLNGARAVQADNLHLTLEFLGGLNSEQITRACQAAVTVKAESFQLHLDHYACLAQPRVVYAGLYETPAAALALQQQLRVALQQLALPTEQRPWLPHVSLFRKAPPLAAAAMTTRLQWQVTDFCLVESCSTDQGVRYLPLQRWALQRR